MAQSQTGEDMTKRRVLLQKRVKTQVKPSEGEIFEEVIKPGKNPIKTLVGPITERKDKQDGRDKVVQVQGAFTSTFVCDTWKKRSK